MRKLLVCALLAFGCSQHKQMTKVDDSGLSRLDEQQMQPVDDARVEEGRAQDALARARAAEADARAQMEVARSDKAIADARLKRAVAERDLLKKQYAPRDQQTRADEEIQAAQDAVKAAELKAQYVTQLIGVREAERNVAEAHIATTHMLTEQAKYQAMKAGNAPQAEAVNSGDLDHQLAASRQHEAELDKHAAELRSNAVALYNSWQQADSRARVMAQPATTPPPPVTNR